MSLFAELKRRKVYKVGAAYLVVGWLLIEVSATILPQLDFPEWAPRMVTLLILLGLPITLVLAWVFEAGPDGVKADVSRIGSKRMFAIAAGIAALALGWYFQTEPAIRKGSAEAPVFTAAKPAAPVADARSIAVLPFLNMSDEASNRYFSDGISEELLNVLARVDGFEVASRTSSFAYRNGELGAATIANRLKVNYLLEGSVRKSGKRVRITAQLIDAGKERQVWSGAYDREMTDIFAVQDEIANAIARALQGSLSSQAVPAIVVPAATRNTEAYELYLQARELFVARSHLDESVRLYEKAIALDPAFARAWDGLAAVAVVAEIWGVKDRDYTEVARVSAQKALQLDPGLAQPWGVLGMVEEIGRRPINWEKSLALMDKSLALDAKNPTILLWRSGALIRLGYWDGALAYLERCLALEPAYLNCERTKALVLLFQGRTGAALESFRRGASQGFLQGHASSFVAPFLTARDRPMARKLMDQLGVPVDVQPALEQALLQPERQDPASRAKLAAFLNSAGTGASWAIGPSRRALWLGDFDGVADAQWRDKGVIIVWDRIPAAFRESAAFKRILEEAGIAAYWRKHGFPPQCRPESGSDFTCDAINAGAVK